MIYFISDTHFYHRNIITFGKRPFKDEQEMNQILVKNWNDTVTDQDTIYIVGDMFCRVKSKEEIENILKQLKGKKYLVIGNHDTSWLKKYPELKEYFKNCQEEYLLHYAEKGMQRTIILSHYPQLEWKNYYKGAYHIFGHIHNKKDEPQTTYLKLQNKMFNATVEINNYKPVTFEEIKKNNEIFYERETENEKT